MSNPTTTIASPDSQQSDRGALGFVGLGVMGEPMCRNLARKSDRTVIAYDPLPEPTKRLGAVGVQPGESPAAIVDRVDVLFLALPNGIQVEAVCRGEGGILARTRPGQIIVDLGTSPVGLTRELAGAFAERGAIFVDAPVARTRQAAEDGTLSIMVGATEDMFERVRPLLSCFASDVILCGPVGSGQVVKILNNMVLFTTVMSLSEALALGKRSGVIGDTLFKAFSQGSADSFALRSHGLNAVLPEQFPERSFSVEYALKDLSYALDLSREFGLTLSCATVVKDLLSEAILKGHGARYWPVVSKLIEQRTT